MSRFVNVAARARDADDISKLMALRTGILVGGELWKDIQRKGVSSVNEFLNRAQEWINLEEAEASVAGTSQVPDQPAGVGMEVVAATQNVTQKNQLGGAKRKGNGEGSQHGPKKNKPVDKFKPVYATCTELTHSRENIFLENSTRLP